MICQTKCVFEAWLDRMSFDAGINSRVYISP